MPRYFYLILFSLLISGCYGASETDVAIEQWKGAGKEEVIRVWKMHSEKVDDTKDPTIVFALRTDFDGVVKKMEATDNQDCDQPGNCQAISGIKQGMLDSCVVAITFDTNGQFDSYFALPGCKESDIPMWSKI